MTFAPNYDAFAGTVTTKTDRPLRASRALAYHEGACAHLVCPYPPGFKANDWFRGLYDGFVRDEKARYGVNPAYNEGFAAAPMSH